MIEWLLAGWFCFSPEECINPRSFGTFETKEVCEQNKPEAISTMVTFLRQNSIPAKMVLTQCVSREVSDKTDNNAG